jgi:hypothetical protein
MRLERYDCDESHEILETLRKDEAWQVRAYAVRSLGRKRLPVDGGAFDDEQEPRVLRTALRYGYAMDTQRVGRGVRYLARSDDLEDKMLAVELGIASGDPDLAELARETARKIILRMGRADAGSLSPRLAAVTGQWGLRRHYRWQHWLRRTGRRFSVHPALSVAATTDDPLDPGVLSRLDPERFAALESYIDNLAGRSVDLVICLDCTASMSGEPRRVRDQGLGLHRRHRPRPPAALDADRRWRRRLAGGGVPRAANGLRQARLDAQAHEGACPGR